MKHHNEPKRILILGATGMLGNAVLRRFVENGKYEVFGSIRSPQSLSLLANNLHKNIISGINVENPDELTRLFGETYPDIVINCIGVVKQLATANDPLETIPINSLLPHRLAKLCQVAGARMIHMSTDCVFSGSKGMYSEEDVADADDLYGRTKFLGEVNYPHTITLRTSIIGHELSGARSLVGWFLKQEEEVTGFRNAFFSGLPTIEIADIINDYVIPNDKLYGTYNVSAQSISKYDLLSVIKEVYKKEIKIIPNDEFKIDRSLDSTRFRQATGFAPKQWSELVKRMHEFG